MNAKLAEIGQIAITVESIERSLPFYRDVLGLNFLFSPSPGLAFLSAGSVRIMLGVPEGSGKPGCNSILYFKVNDIGKSYADLLNRGAAGEREPHFVAKLSDHELWLAFLRDPDNNLVGLMEEIFLKAPGAEN